MEKKCPNCGGRVAPKARRCPCGFEFSASGMDIAGSKAARDVGMDTGVPLSKTGSPLSKTGSARHTRDTGKASDRKARKAAKAAESTHSPVDNPRLMPCPHCEAQISKRAPLCPNCKQSPFAMCLICEAKVPARIDVCPECGDPDPFRP